MKNNLINQNENIFNIFREWMPNDRRSSKDFFFASFSLSAIFWLILLFPGLLFLNEPHAAWSTLITAAVILINFVVWCRGVPLVWAHSVFQISTVVLIIFNALHMGGVASPAMVWLGIVPILPFFVVSRRWSYFWIFITFFVVLSMCFAQSKGLIDTGDTGSPALWATMIGLLAITQAMLVITYDAANSEHIRNIKTKNEQLRNLTDRLQIVNADKDKFLATVSHELRTPLNVVIGYLNLLNSNRQLPSQASEQIKHALNSSSLLLTVVNDLLDYTQIKQGQLAFVPQTVQLKNVIFEAHSALVSKASEQKLAYFLELSDKLPTWAHIDPNRLTQIIFNLLSNAIKFTPKGFVELRADYIPTHASSGNLHLCVTDSGVGIPLASQQSVFEPFVQLDNQHRTTQDDALRGNGLGLSIVESLIRGWGGSIQLLSTPNQGTCFEVWLPFDTVHPKNGYSNGSADHFADKVFTDNLKILIVDDHALNRMVAAATIHQYLPNAVIDEAKNGFEALKKMSTQLYDVVLMDLVMPDMTGTEVVRRIRIESPAPFQHVRVVAFTANLSEAARKECHEIGITEMLPKPLNREALIQTLRKNSV